MCPRLRAASLFLFSASLIAQTTAPVPLNAASAQLTAAQDHQRMMDLLHIVALRPGVSQNGKSYHPVNWDEAKANPWPSLPNPLVLNNGKRLKDAKTWSTKRRPELVELFDREIFGRVPANAPAVHWEVDSTTPGNDGDIATITKRLVGHVDHSAYPAITLNIEVTLTLPAGAPKPVPVVLEFQAVYPRSPTRPAMPPPVEAHTPPPPPTAATVETEPSIKHQVLAKGWAFATINGSSLQADSGAGLSQGIITLCSHGQPRKLNDWGVLRVWAWGGSRAMDYFETDKDLDAHHVAVEGHSRYGKTALVAMAYDQRFAVAYINSSGAGGADLARRRFGEQLENIAGTGEYHWMDGNYLKYAEVSPKEITPADMPVDMHELIALCAPRPIFIGGGTPEGGDGWADVRGTFIAEVAAGPVYKLLGKRDLGTAEFPPVGTALTSGDLAFRQHPGGHNPLPNFATFLTFASRYMGPQK